MEEKKSQNAPYPTEWDHSWRETTSFYNVFAVAYDLWDPQEYDNVVAGVDLPTIELQKVLHKYTGGLSCLTYDDEMPMPHPTDKMLVDFWLVRAPVISDLENWGECETVFQEELPDGYYNSVYVYENGVIQLAIGGCAAQSASSIYFYPTGLIANTQDHALSIQGWRTVKPFQNL
tara:strand:+ start:66 stop:590 length:525 start_codon:yes stop_codon:yes gene_type:complete